MFKRMVIGLVVVTLALGGLGLLTVSAQDDATAKAYLGVRIAEEDEGVTVVIVEPDSPADEAGLRRGDVIEAVDGTAIESADQLTELIQSYAPGDEITLTISWRGEARDVVATLAERPSIQVVPWDMPRLRDSAGQPLMRGMMSMLGLDLTISDDGVVVEEIAEDSPLADSGLLAGDVITAINGESLADADLVTVMQALHGAFAEDSLTLTVDREGESVELTIDLSTLDLPDMPFAFGLGDLSLEGMPMMGRRALLGVSYQTITPEVMEAEGLTVEQGALVVEVGADSPAEAAGIEAGDVIVAVNGDAVDEEHTLGDRIAAYEAGDTLTLDILRDGETLSLEVELAPVASMMGQPGMFFFAPGEGMGRQGMGRHGFFGQQGGMAPRGRMMEQFFENHPFMGEMYRMMPHGGMFEMMPNGGMFFRFGPAQAVPEAVTPDASAPAAPAASGVEGSAA